MVQINTTCNVENRAASEGSRKGEATERVEPAGGERAPVRSPDSRSPETQRLSGNIMWDYKAFAA
jgi:hypothetical protein